MIQHLFDEPKPIYVSIVNDTFKIDEKLYQTLRVLIQDMKPVRKFFDKGKLLCYSINNKTSKTGKYCALCADRTSCKRKIRIMMLVINIHKEPVPVILEINPYSFQSLKELIKTIPADKIPETIVDMKIIYSDTQKKYIEFSTG